MKMKNGNMSEGKEERKMRLGKTRRGIKVDEMK